jgi:hypothetical protein
MTSFRQFAANRRNAFHSTGPKTESGKQQSRLNAVRHGLTAETVVGSLEDAEDYKAFEGAVIEGYDAQTAVERELVLRLASLLWRLRRATAVETYLLEIQTGALRPFEGEHDLARRDQSRNCCGYPVPSLASHSLVTHDVENESHCGRDGIDERHGPEVGSSDFANRARKMAYSFLRLSSHDSQIFERLSRYEAALWRQTVQTLLVLQSIKLR